MHKRFLLAAAGLLASAAAILPAGAHAASGTTCQVTGSMYENDFTALQSDTWSGAPANGFPGTNEIQIFTHPITVSGGIGGIGFDQERAWGNVRTADFTSHDNVTFGSFTDPSDPTVQYTPATITCPGTSRTGGLVISFLATGNYLAGPIGPDGNPVGAFNAHFEIVGSSGGLAGTTGSGSMSGAPGVPGGNGIYTATIHLR